MSIIKSFFLKHNQYCLYAYTLQNTYLKLWSLFSLGGGGFDTDTLPLQIILKIRNLRRMTLPRSPALHKKQLDVQPTFGKSKILNMIMPCCIYEYLPFFLITRVFVFLCHCIVWCKHRSQKFTLWRRVNSL